MATHGLLIQNFWDKQHVFRNCQKGSTMRWYHIRLAFPSLLLPLFVLQDAQAYEVDPATFLLLPQHCQARFAALNVTGIQLDRARYQQDIDRYRRQLKGAWDCMNHYCPGLVALIRAERSQSDLEAKKRDRLLDTALGEIKYQLRCGELKWTENSLWLKAEVYKNLGRVYFSREQFGDAIRSYQQAIDVYPAYIPAYWDLAELERRQKRFDAAINHLEKALATDPPAKHAKLIEAKIRELEGEKNSPDPALPETKDNGAGE
jgi:tetratricopeptide (TPR) repeat protein